MLVSEIMLQQTQADRVVGYFERFMGLFPSIEDLADASLGEVLAAWSGLGYNRRARYLHEAAGQIASRGWPTSVAGLLELPGVGPYTARAIAGFAFNAEEVPVDTNVRRVLSRWHGEALDGHALQLMANRDRESSDTSVWTQAVMDLGAGVCRPRVPKCNECPVAAWCSGPETYVPPRAQARFEGSARQLRGSIIRKLIDGPVTREALVRSSGFPADAVDDALTDLQGEGLITRTGGRYRLPD